MRGFAITKASLHVCKFTVQSLIVNHDACSESITPEIFATDQALRLVQEGYSFRDAYRMVAQAPQTVMMENVLENLRCKTHQGAPGNLGLEIARKRSAEYTVWAESMRHRSTSAIEELLHNLLPKGNQ